MTSEVKNIPEIVLEKIKEKFTNVNKDYFFQPEGVLMQKGDLTNLLKHCTDIGVSDIHIEGEKHIIGDISGRMWPITIKKLTSGEAANLLKRIYDENAITRIDSIEAIDTNYSMKTGMDTYRFRVNAVGSTVGSDKTVQITIRTLPEIPPKLKIVDRGQPLDVPKGYLGLEREIWDNFSPSQGMVIVTGPTGSGKSTLLAGGIRKLAEVPDINKKIITYEAPIEFVYDRCDTPSCVISQTEIGTQLKTFHDGIESGMRRKPDIILIGEARDPETIDSSILASQTGHLVYTTSHTNGVAETMKRLINVFPENERQAKLMDLVDSMKMVIAQRLLKTVDGGRCAIKEFLVFDKPVKDILRTTNAMNISTVLDEIVTDKRQRLIDDAYLRFQEGLISQETFDVCEKDFGNLNKSDEDIFKMDDEKIRYLDAKDFAKEDYVSYLHCGIVINKKSGNHGKVAFVPKHEMDIESFTKDSESFISKTYNELEYTNKEIVLDLKLLFENKKKKNKKDD